MFLMNVFKGQFGNAGNRMLLVFGSKFAMHNSAMCLILVIVFNNL